jgi:hypothetical protein
MKLIFSFVGLFIFLFYFPVYVIKWNVRYEYKVFMCLQKIIWRSKGYLQLQGDILVFMQEYNRYPDKYNL